MDDGGYIILIGLILMIAIVGIGGAYLKFYHEEEPVYKLYQFKDGTRDYCQPPEIWGSRYNYKSCCSGTIHTMATDVIESGMAVMNCSGIASIRR